MKDFNIMRKNIRLIAISLLLGWVQMANASHPVWKLGSAGEEDPATRAHSQGLSAPVRPASTKAVTRFSTGSAHLRQQVQEQRTAP